MAQWRVGVLTDLGTSHAHVEASLSGCDALVLECNHDLDMLANGDYPRSLKQRIAGQASGISTTTAAAALLAPHRQLRLQASSSRRICRKQNNTPEICARARARGRARAARRLDRHRRTRRTGFGWRELA